MFLLPVLIDEEPSIFRDLPTTFDIMSILFIGLEKSGI